MNNHKRPYFEELEVLKIKHELQAALVGSINKALAPKVSARLEDEDVVIETDHRRISLDANFDISGAESIIL